MLYLLPSSAFSCGPEKSCIPLYSCEDFRGILASPNAHTSVSVRRALCNNDKRNPMVSLSRSRFCSLWFATLTPMHHILTVLSTPNSSAIVECFQVCCAGAIVVPTTLSTSPAPFTLPTPPTGGETGLSSYTRRFLFRHRKSVCSHRTFSTGV